MERLTIDEVIEHCNRQTERMENNFGRSQLEEKPMMGNLNIMKHYWEHRQVAKWLKELKEYRDLEEQGRLIKLPYKAGERVWILYKDKLIEENYVASIQIGEKCDRLCFADGYVYTIWNKDYEEAKKWVYTSKEEAEKALAEMGE